MEIGSLFVGLALLALVAFVIAQPFLENQGVREHRVTPRDALEAERDQVLDALRDLDFDHTMGKITEEDYTPQRTFLMGRGAAVLQQLDALAAVPTNGHGRAPAAVEDQLEQAIAARRKGPRRDPDAQMEAAIAARRTAAAGPACSRCGTPANAGDRFCAKCGGTLTPSPVCTECGTPLKAGDRFCGKCGAKVLDTAATGAA